MGASSITLVVLAALAIWLALRAALIVDVGLKSFSVVQLVHALAVGLWFDIATLAFLLAPWCLVAAIFPNRWRAARPIHVLRWAALGVVLATLLFEALAEFVFWQEFTTRFNFIAVDYLIYTQEVIGNIWQSYPIVWLLVAIAVTTIALLIIAQRFVRLSDAPRALTQRLIMLAIGIGAPLLAWQLSNVDQMEATGNAYADELSGNGFYTLAAAMRRNELDYERFYRVLPQPIADAVLKRLGVTAQLPDAVSAAETSASPSAFISTASSTPPPLHLLRRPRNVVLISVESLSAEYLGSFGNTHHLTPKLDQLAAAGVKFNRMFAVGTRTVRGLEALSLGTPPIPGQAIVRRPNNAHFNTLGEVLHDARFDALFIYGGFGYFDNMNAYFAANNYRVLDRTDFPAKSVVFGNIWGVADEALFDNALVALNGTARRNQPFFAHIMTTSNHRPYTYPDGRIDIASPGGRSGAVKYTDYAIGKFIDDARRSSWFRDTLFVIIADHCASVAGKTRLPVDRYHIPMIFYGPEIVAPAVVDRTLSQIDVPPTLLDALGIPGRERFFGDSLLRPPTHAARAFISNYQQLGYYKNDVLTVLSPHARVEALRIDPRSFQATPMTVDTELRDEATAYYQTAARAFKSGALRHEAVPATKPSQ